MGFGQLFGVGNSQIGTEWKADPSQVGLGFDRGASEGDANAALKGQQVYGTQQYQLASGAAPGAFNGLGAQNALLGDWMAQAAGVGPNPALEQLKQTTNANIAQQAGAVAGARGLNPAMAARLISQRGAALSQQAAGQAAVQSAQQQIAARQAAGQLAGQMVGQYGDTLSAQANQNLQQQQILQAAIANRNNAAVSRQNATDAANAGLAQTNVQTDAQVTGGLFGGLGGALSFLSEGGEVPGPCSSLGKGLRKRMSDGGTVPGKAPVAGDSKRNDVVPAQAGGKPLALSPGEFVVKRTVAQMPGMKAALTAINEDPKAARSFIAHLQARKGAGFEKVVRARGGKAA